MSKISIQDYDIVFISYDEPNADANWASLLGVFPTAKRVHGVKGSDAAHKAAARLVTTDRFITVDGDNVVDGSFANQVVELDDTIDITKTVFSWPSINVINGLLYGNGGIKCWPTQLVLTMQTHESADPANLRAQIDFCWDLHYAALDTCYSKTVTNVTPYQAWRAGFREGVKMSLDQGKRVENASTLFSGNVKRLLTWMMVGMDVENGKWAILGARQGCYATMCTDWDFVNVRDFDYLHNYWSTNVSHLSYYDVVLEINKLGGLLSNVFPIAEVFTPSQSAFFKQFNINTNRQLPSVSTSVTDQQYDIVMITFGELEAEQNWGSLKRRFPRAKRVDGVKGIHAAHQAAAKMCDTDMFWVVDGDTKVFNNFEFDYIVPLHKKDTVHVWRARNPVNGLEYGYGGIKLLPRKLTENMDVSNADMTTSISTKYKPVMEVASITDFATDEYSTWRSAFRECCKLASKVIDRQNDAETDRRLSQWLTNSSTHKFSQICMEGAKAGKQYGESNIGDGIALRKINDFNWLMEQYNAR